MKSEPLWIMVAGPYGSGARTDAERAQNLRAMNKAAVEVFRRGHVPVIGVNMALPMIDAAGGQASFGELMMPVSLSLAKRCDAVLRIGGPSAGADQEVKVIEDKGGIVYYTVKDIPFRSDIEENAK